MYCSTFSFFVSHSISIECKRNERWIWSVVLNYGSLCLFFIIICYIDSLTATKENEQNKYFSLNWWKIEENQKQKHGEIMTFLSRWMYTRMDRLKMWNIKGATIEMLTLPCVNILMNRTKVIFNHLVYFPWTNCLSVYTRPRADGCTTFEWVELIGKKLAKIWEKNKTKM